MLELHLGLGLEVVAADLQEKKELLDLKKDAGHGTHFQYRPH